MYYLNENFRSNDDFSINGLKIIQTLGCKLTNENEEDIIYLFGKETDEEDLYKDLRIYIMQKGGKIKKVATNIKEGYIPKVKVVPFNSNRENTIIYSSETGYERSNKHILCYTYLNNQFSLSFNSDEFEGYNRFIIQINNDKSYRVLSEDKNEEYRYYDSNLGSRKGKKEKKTKNTPELKKIVDFRLAYDFDTEDYTLIIYQKVTDTALMESECKLKKDQLKFISQQLVIR